MIMKKSIIWLSVLSLMLGVCTVSLSIIPCDFNLIKLLIFDIKTVLLNSFPLFCVMGILYLLSGRMWLSFSLVSLITFLMAEVNRFKLMFRDEPFVFSDMVLIGEAGQIIKNYSLRPDIASVCVAVLLILAAVASFFFVKEKLSGKLLKTSGITALCLVMILAYNFVYTNNRAVYDSMWHKQFGTDMKKASSSMSRGFVYYFINSIPQSTKSKPDGYNKKRAAEIMSQYADGKIPAEKKVNIISIMLEAYNDFSTFDGVDFEIDPYKNFHFIQENSYSGNLYTNIFAGDTVQSERSFLTGFGSSSYFKKCDTFVSYLKNNGYYTEAMHPSYGWFYNRQNVNRFLGFDNFDYYENKYGSLENLRAEKYCDMLSDIDFFDQIKKGFENSEKPYFNFSVTYQNHGAYSPEDIWGTHFVTKKDGYNDADYNTFNNYINGIYKTDIALLELYEYINQQEEPIVLILFGDHNPLLGENNSGYKMLGININLETEDGAQNYYKTPYVICANEPAKKALGKDFKGIGNTVSPMFLMTEFFQYAGIEGSAYMNYLADIKKETDVINPVYLKKDGKYVPRNTINSQTLTERQWVEYYLKNKPLHN